MTEKERKRLRWLAENQTPGQLKKLGIKRSQIAKQRIRDNHGRFIKATT